jgi:chromatin remodeling complex protein RSC6
MTTNGKKEKTNGKAVEKINEKVAPQEEEKIIPTEDWKNFANFWDSTEWKDLTEKDIKKHLGKYLFVAIPKNITDPKIGKAWFDEIKQYKEKKASFGGYNVCFKDQTATLSEVFGDKPLTTTEMTKRLYFYINDHSLSSKNSEPKPEIKVEEKNGKNTVKVNSIEAMEKAVETIKPKKGKK